MNLRSIDKKFPERLLKRGDGQINNFVIPESWKTADVFSKIYGNMKNNIENSVILATHNEEIDKLNSKILNMHRIVGKPFLLSKAVPRIKPRVLLKSTFQPPKIRASYLA